MNITQATAAINSALDDGRIDRETAIRAQQAIRGSYYGNRMTNLDRVRMLSLRFGIV